MPRVSRNYARKDYSYLLNKLQNQRQESPVQPQPRMQALGVDLATIQSLVGHADVDMTKHYLHVQDPVRQSAIAKFENAFFEKPQEVHRNIIEFVKSS